MKILIGATKAFRYLHSTEPLPTLHRDIKSENILVTETLEPRIADLGEARVMAENGTMTMVGTNGYTAPEVLRGEHCELIKSGRDSERASASLSRKSRPYSLKTHETWLKDGTPADVFSFAIVMSEVVTLQPPYEDMMSGESPASMGHIVKMTQPPTSIRPTVSVAEDGVVNSNPDQSAWNSRTQLNPQLPDELNESLQTLICDCWNAEQSLRPSMEVILLRLRMVVQTQKTRLRGMDSLKMVRLEVINQMLSFVAHTLSNSPHSPLDDEPTDSSSKTTTSRSEMRTNGRRPRPSRSAKTSMGPSGVANPGSGTSGRLLRSSRTTPRSWQATQS